MWISCSYTVSGHPRRPGSGSPLVYGRTRIWPGCGSMRSGMSPPSSVAWIADTDSGLQRHRPEPTRVSGCSRPGGAGLAVVTHSQGGLILQRYLAWMLGEGRGRELTTIRLIVTLSCPNEGSEYLSSIRAVAGLGRHPHAGQLDVLWCRRERVPCVSTVVGTRLTAPLPDDTTCR